MLKICLRNGFRTTKEKKLFFFNLLCVSRGVIAKFLEVSKLQSRAGGLIVLKFYGKFMESSVLTGRALTFLGSDLQ